MSRDLAAHEKALFQKQYGTGAQCQKCGNRDIAIRIWERFGSTARLVDGDISPQGIVAAVIVCEACGHGQIVSRSEILQAQAAAAS